ncbi:TonB-dependent receptor [Sphingosinicella microcystinivorans]|uniref:TonB-dependent receptor n=1 Tax=Sphingosinicella microcystinivorans TaxID=335406 RepID=A0AAD1FZC0_SPHMI|nr:TonB-dependent receptor [Sphingosinicella microcystinivorans]RKS88649.1 TonB-dependent receptor-like protein [Sphingosinicella microcystinivorans]BBE32395.1 TonB-dependent receptor [Sphingosinicella microcystinivorans]
MTIETGLMRAVLLLGAAAVPAMPAAVQAAETDYSVHIPAGPLDGALKALANQTGRQLLYTSALVAGRTAPALGGRFTPEAALARLLGDAPIAVRAVSPSVFVLEAKTPAPRAKPSAPPRPAKPRADGSAARAGTPANDPETIVVTGSNIRGARPAAPVIRIDRTDIDRSGYASVAEVLAALPQSFGGTGSEDTSITGIDRSIVNSGFGSSANLRGLGSDATLTLVNGRRLAGSGSNADFSDISSVPLIAIDRIEVLPDGASALYGSDAVGGVVNIILKRDPTHWETRARIGTVTKGGAQDYLLAQTGGAAWSGGQLVAAYEYQHRDALAASARPYAASFDLRPLGGDDFRTTYAYPGTILRLDGPSGSLLPAFAIPAGQDGTALAPGDFTSGANYYNFREGADILPEQTRHSGWVSAEQRVGDIRLFAEGRYSHRRFAFLSPASVALLPVTAANPWFVSPTGSAFDYIGYAFGPEIGPARSTGRVESWSTVGGAVWSPGGDWDIEVSGGYAQERTRNVYENLVNQTHAFEALGTIPDDPATAWSTARDGYFNPYSAVPFNGADVLDFIAEGFSREYVKSRLATADVKADGTLVSHADGDIRLALGAGVRREFLDRRGSSFYSGTTPATLQPVDADRSVRAVFAELSVPIVGAGNARAGLQRLDLSAAVRHERYSDFGHTTNPKLGLVWSPLQGLDLRGSWGTSFRAPGLREIGDPLNVSATQLATPAGGRMTAISLGGGNPDLDPERAHSLSLGARFAPARAGFSAEVNLFETRFRGRIGRPAYEDLSRVLLDPDFAPFLRFIDAANPDDVAYVEALIAHPGSMVSGSLPVSAFQVVVDGRYANTARVVVRGLDVQLAQRWTLGSGEASLALSGTWLTDYKRRITTAAPMSDKVATVGFPSDLRVRTSAGWNRSDVGLTLTMNYVDGYADPLSTPARKVDAGTTFDAQLRYSPQDVTWAEGLTLALSVQNLFANDPPFVNNSFGVGYDPANADPSGRQVSLQLSRRW